MNIAPENSQRNDQPYKQNVTIRHKCKDQKKNSRQQIRKTSRTNIQKSSSDQHGKRCRNSRGYLAGTYKPGKKGKQGKYSYKGPAGRIRKLKLTLGKDLCAMTAKKIDLSAWTGGDVTIKVEIGDYINVLN